MAKFIMTEEASAPATPSTNNWTFYFKSTGLYFKDDAGTETGPLGIGLSDGDKGDITLTSGGTVWTIDNNAVSLAKLATQAANTILAEATGSTAVPTAVAVAANKFLARASTGNIAAKDITDFALTILDDANAAAVLTTIGALPLAGGTMTGKIVSAGSSEVGATYTPATGAQTVALDCAVNNMHIVTGHANGTAITFTIANAVNSQIFAVSILQGGTTPSTISSWFATVRWAGGATPTLTATINKRDTFIFIRTGANTYDGFIVGQNN